MRNFELNYPNKIIKHLESLSTETLFIKELNALKNLEKLVSIEVLAEAVDNISRNGLPPNGKLSLYPLTDLERHPEVLALFQGKQKSTLDKSISREEISESPLI